MALEIVRLNSGLSRGRGSFLSRVWRFARQELRGRIIDTLSRTPLGSLVGLGGPALAGVEVNESRAMGMPAVWCALTWVSETLAMLPHILYENQGNGKRKAKEHPLYRVLRWQANPYQTSAEFWSTMLMQTLLYGNSYAEIVRRGDGQVAAVYNLQPWCMRKSEDKQTGALVYQYQDQGRTVTLRPEQVLDLPGPTPVGLVGLPPVQVCREALGIGLALEMFAAKFFGNGSWMGGVVSIPQGTLPSDEEFDRTKKEVEEAHKTAMNAHKVLFLDGGLEYKPLTMSPEDAQALESRTFSVLDVARIWRVPPQFLMDYTNSTKANAAEQTLQFKVAMLPWAKRIEQRVQMSLLSEAERERFFMELLWNEFVQVEMEKRFASYSQALQAGWMCPNDVRSLENMNPLPGDQGDIFARPANMVPGDQFGKEPAAEPAPDAVDKVDEVDGVDKKADPGADDEEDSEEEEAPVKDKKKKKGK